MSRIATTERFYLRGSEEHQHHSLVLRKAANAACNRLGFKVGNESISTSRGLLFRERDHLRVREQPFQAARCSSPIPMASRSSSMPQWRSARICAPLTISTRAATRSDSIISNVFAAEVQDTVDFYARLGSG